MVWLEGPGVVYAEVTDKGNGTYTAAYNASVAGMYELFITNGELLFYAGKGVSSKSLTFLVSIGQYKVCHAR